MANINTMPIGGSKIKHKYKDLSKWFHRENVEKAVERLQFTRKHLIVSKIKSEISEI